MWKTGLLPLLVLAIKVKVSQKEVDIRKENAANWFAANCSSGLGRNEKIEKKGLRRDQQIAWTAVWVSRCLPYCSARVKIFLESLIDIYTLRTTAASKHHRSFIIKHGH